LRLPARNLYEERHEDFGSVRMGINTAVTNPDSSRETPLAYRRYMGKSGVLLFALLFSASSALADPLPVSLSIAPTQSPTHARQLLLIDERTKNDVPYIRLQTPINQRITEAPQAQLSQGVVVPSMMPVSLRIEPMAGHLGLVSAQDAGGRLGITTVIANNVLGVGITQAYGVALGDRITASPFVALDYNRVDSTRYINLNSPRPFTNDNADTGLTATFGIAIRPTLGSVARLAPSVFIASVIGSDNTQFVPREASSVGARIVQSIGSNGPEVMWSEVGTGIDYRLSGTSLLRAALVQTIGHPNGDGITAQVVWRARW
jgi:hypothetical protein